MSYTGEKLVEKAYELAHIAHEGQMYGDRPYTAHLEEVEAYVAQLGYAYRARAVGILHDICEDTEVTVNDLLAEGIPPEVCLGVEAMTWKEEDALLLPSHVSKAEAKITKARSDPLGHVGKFSDASRNLANSLQSTVDTRLSISERAKGRKRVSRYGGYVALLLPGLPTPEDINRFLDKIDELDRGLGNKAS